MYIANVNRRVKVVLKTKTETETNQKFKRWKRDLFMKETIKWTNLEGWTSWFLSPHIACSLAFGSCAALDKSLNFPQPLFSHLWESRTRNSNSQGTDYMKASRMCLYCYLCILTQVSLVKTIPSSFTKQVCVPEALWGQTERPDFGTEKGLLQGQAKRTGDTCPQTPNASKVFGEKYVYRQNS